MTRTIFKQEFAAKDAEANLKKIMEDVLEEIRHKKIQDVKVIVEVTESRINFRVVGN